MKRSGVCERDEVCLATAPYNKKKVQHPNEDVGPPFRFLGCWESLRVLPKFSAAGQVEQSKSEDDNRDPSVSDTEKTIGSSEESCVKQEVKDESKVRVKIKSEDRPVGRQFAKQQRALEQHRSKKLRLANEVILLQKKQVEALERHNDIHLFTQGPGGADMGKEFFLMQQNKRLKIMKDELEKEKNNKDDDDEIDNI